MRVNVPELEHPQESATPWRRAVLIGVALAAVIAAVVILGFTLVIRPAWDDVTEPTPLAEGDVQLQCSFEAETSTANLGFHYNGPVFTFAKRGEILVEVEFQDQDNVVLGTTAVTTPAFFNPYANWTKTPVPVTADTTDVTCAIRGIPTWVIEE